MNINAANALLKNLEEPPSRTRVHPDRPFARQPAADDPLALPDGPASSRSATTTLIAALARGRHADAGRRRAAGAARRAPAAARATAILLTAVWRAGNRRGARRARRRGEPRRRRRAPAGRCGRRPRPARSSSTCSTAMRSTFWREPPAQAAPSAATSARADTLSRGLAGSRGLRYAETETYNLDRKQHALNMIVRLQRHASNVTPHPCIARWRFAVADALFHRDHFHSDIANGCIHVTRKILPHHADLLSERQAAYRPCL